MKERKNIVEITEGTWKYVDRVGFRYLSQAWMQKRKKLRIILLAQNQRGTVVH